MPTEPSDASSLTAGIPPTITLLGPQRHPRLDAVVDSLGLSGRFATITAGWRDREPDDELLTSMLGGNTVNLQLWGRMQQVWDADPAFAEADRRRRAALEEMQRLYLLGLDHAISALREVHAHDPRSPGVRDLAIADVQRIVADMDRRHLDRVAETYATFWAAWPPHERPAVAAARELIARELADVEAVVIPGGHVGVLLGALHLFNIAPRLTVPVIAWGAGAMVLTDRIVLFHDRAAHGPAVAEVYAAGLGRVRNTVALPSARERLELEDTVRMTTLVHRVEPARCLLLDRGARVDIGPDGLLPPGAPVIGADGRPTTAGAPG